MNLLNSVLIIMAINIAYVSLFTIRMMFVLKGLKIFASLLSMIEVFVYILGLQYVLDHLDHPVNLLAYCVGWGSGVYLGSKIEEWIALGYSAFQIVSERNTSLPEKLRERGFAVTSWRAEEREESRLGMTVLSKRRNEKSLLQMIETFDPQAFVISYEPRFFRRGFWPK